ncbi:hypothetical protein CR513_26920, partial [Mucuna pruriens]
MSSNMLVFKSRLKLITGKLRPRWDGPFVITNVFPYGVVELKDENTNSTFQVNGHQIKLFQKVQHQYRVCANFSSISAGSGPTSMKQQEAMHNPGGKLITNQSRKTMINLNLRGQRSFGIILGMGLIQVWGRHPRIQQE